VKATNFFTRGLNGAAGRNNAARKSRTDHQEACAWPTLTNSGTAILQAAYSQIPRIPGKIPANSARRAPKKTGRLSPSLTLTCCGTTPVNSHLPRVQDPTRDRRP